MLILKVIFYFILVLKQLSYFNPIHSVDELLVEDIQESGLDALVQFDLLIHPRRQPILCEDVKKRKKIKIDYNTHWNIEDEMTTVAKEVTVDDETNSVAKVEMAVKKVVYNAIIADDVKIGIENVIVADEVVPVIEKLIENNNITENTIKPNEIEMNATEIDIGMEIDIQSSSEEEE
jgi:hypothetical protein